MKTDNVEKCQCHPVKTHKSISSVEVKKGYARHVDIFLRYRFQFLFSFESLRTVKACIESVTISKGALTEISIESKYM